MLPQPREVDNRAALLPAPMAIPTPGSERRHRQIAHIAYIAYIAYTVGMKGRVVVDPSIMAGKPVIAGTRIPVYLILNLLAHGYDFDRIIQAYPVLTREDVQAAIRYSEARMRREEVRVFDRPA